MTSSLEMLLSRNILLCMRNTNCGYWHNLILAHVDLIGIMKYLIHLLDLALNKCVAKITSFKHNNGWKKLETQPTHDWEGNTKEFEENLSQQRYKNRTCLRRIIIAPANDSAWKWGWHISTRSIVGYKVFFCCHGFLVPHLPPQPCLDLLLLLLLSRFC